VVMMMMTTNYDGGSDGNSCDDLIKGTKLYWDSINNTEE
jgi:hypothetical protein